MSSGVSSEMYMSVPSPVIQSQIWNRIKERRQRNSLQKSLLQFFIEASVLSFCYLLKHKSQIIKNESDAVHPQLVWPPCVQEPEGQVGGFTSTQSAETTLTQTVTYSLTFTYFFILVQCLIMLIENRFFFVWTTELTVIAVMCLSWK